MRSLKLEHTIKNIKIGNITMTRISEMNIKRASNPRIFAVIIILLIMTISYFGQGRLLRGEKWQKYNVDLEKADFFVAPNGNDSWSGKLASVNSSKSDGPFRTIQKAKEAVRELKKKVYTPEEVPIDSRYVGSPHKLGGGRDILVLIREGYYSLEKTLEFSPEDGGERVETNLPTGAFEYHKLKDYFVTYAAYPGENPIISGGKIINKWKTEDQYWVANAGNTTVNKLILNGEGLTLARTPNSGYYTFPVASENTTSFSFNSGEIRNWADMEDNRIKMYLRWHYGINSISEVDESKNMAYLKKPQNGIIVISPRYYIENVKALLDAPGEWYYDKHTKKIFLIPPKKVNPNSVVTSVPVLKTLLNIEGNQERPVRNLRFYGLSYEATESDSSAILFKYANKCEVVDSKINAVGGSGIDVRLGAYQTRILNNKFIRASGGAVRVLGNSYPTNWSDIIRETTISYNYIDECGRTNVHASNSLYTTISHNEITNNLGRYPIYVGGWSNHEEAIDAGYTVEYNHLHHVQSLADDSGVITSGGYTYNSVIRGNLIHHVKKGEFNDNVAIWFDNMSYGWTAEDNIMYALEQGEMKLCAANLVDNLYQNNFRIETPKIEPKGIITGQPDFQYEEIKIGNIDSDNYKNFKTGEFAKVQASIINKGATGIEDVSLYVNGTVVETKKVPLIAENKENITFDYLLSKPGELRIAIGTTPTKIITVVGKPLMFFYDLIEVSSQVIPFGEEITVKAKVKKAVNGERETEVNLYDNNNIVLTKKITFGDSDNQQIEFKYTPKVGVSNIRIGNSKSAKITTYSHHNIDIKETELAEYCDSRAEPHKIDIDKKENKFRIEAGGIDFFHGEDSYASVYLKNPIKGNFVATIKVTGFGDRTNEWFRAGIFARNDMEKSFGTGMGSKGSVLMFVSPGRAGMNWDEFGDGCMHKANSQNHPKMETYPMWIKLVRHGNSFSGYVSYDGKNWTVSRHTNDLPGLNEAIHLGLAAGAPDQKVYSVELENFQINVQDD